MCLRFVFLLAVQIPAWLRLSRRPPTWKDAEILLLRHQLAVLQRQTAARPKLRWTDRALFAALLTLISRSCHGALHLFITAGTILRWHRDIVRRRWAAKSKPKRPGRPPTHRRVVRACDVSQRAGQPRGDVRAFMSYKATNAANRALFIGSCPAQIQERRLIHRYAPRSRRMRVAGVMIMVTRRIEEGR